MKPTQIRTFDWIGERRGKCRYDLGKNELFEQDLAAMGIDTSYESYLKCPDPELYFRETVAELYGTSPDNVIPTAGGTEGIFLASAHLGNVSRRILIPVPDYDPLMTVPRSLGYTVIEGNTEQILSSAGKGDSLSLTSPSNPEGDDRREFIDSMISALGEDSRIYIDETFTEFRFNGKPETFFGKDPRIITSGTMTKFFGLTRLRTGWILASGDDASSIRRYKSLVSASNARYPLWLAANALKNREKFGRVVKRLIESNFPVAEDFVEGTKGLSWNKPGATPFGFVHYSYDVSSEDLCRSVYDDTGILLVPGTYFGQDRGFRLCFFIEPDRFREAIGILKKYLEDRFAS